MGQNERRLPATGNVAYATAFLRSLGFDVRSQDDGLVAERRSGVFGDVAHLLRFEADDALRRVGWGEHERFFKERALHQGTTRKHVVITEKAKSSGQYSAVVSRGQRQDVHVVTFREFLRSFVDIESLEKHSRGALGDLSRVAYIRPIVSAAGQTWQADSFIEEVLLSPIAPRFLLLHAPAGRGKTLLAEHVARELLTRTRSDPVIPIPFLVKFGDHRGVIRVDALLSEALRRYGLDLIPECVEQLVRHGVFLLILDGFDELLEKSGESLSLDNVIALARSINKRTRGRALLTSRTTFLTLNWNHVSQLLAQSDRMADARELQEIPIAEAPPAGDGQAPMLFVALEEFDDERVTAFLEANRPEVIPAGRREGHRDRVRAFIREQGIDDLVREPLVLGMVSEVVAASPGALPRNMSEVYERFMAGWCDRESRRKDLPTELPQLTFLSTLASTMVELGTHAVELEWVEEAVDSSLHDYLAGTDSEFRAEVTSKLCDHALFSPESFAQAALIQFRHQSYRDFLAARALRTAFLESDREFLSSRFGQFDLPEGVLDFLAEMIADDGRGVDTDRLRSTLDPSLGRGSFRNLIRLAAAWDDDERFRAVVAPPDSIAGKDLSGLALRGLDLRGYRWSGTVLDGVTFLECNLSGARLGDSVWRVVRVRGSTLAGTDFGDQDRRVEIDGEILEGEALAAGLAALGALGVGVRELQTPPAPKDLVVELLREVFKKVLEGDRPENTRIVRKKLTTFERGRLCAQHPEFVRQEILPALLNRPDGFLERTGDRLGTVKLRRERVGEIVGFLFREEVSASLQLVVDDLRPRLM